MIKKIKSTFFLLFFLTFIFFTVKYYFSEKNILIVNKSRSTYALNLIEEQDNIPVLKNDTNNIIVYKNELEVFNKKRKKRIWEKLISD